MIVAGFVFTSVSAYMAGLVKLVEQPGLRDHDLHDPVRLAAAGGTDGSRRGARPVAAIMIGSVVCCAACIAATTWDLKCGNMVGATPWRSR